MGTIAYVKRFVRLDVRELAALLCKRSIDLKCKLPLYRHGIDMQASACERLRFRPYHMATFQSHHRCSVQPHPAEYHSRVRLIRHTRVLTG